MNNLRILRHIFQLTVLDVRNSVESKDLVIPTDGVLSQWEKSKREPKFEVIKKLTDFYNSEIKEVLFDIDLNEDPEYSELTLDYVLGYRLTPEMLNTLASVIERKTTDSHTGTFEWPYIESYEPLVIKSKPSREHNYTGNPNDFEDVTEKYWNTLK